MKWASNDSLLIRLGRASERARKVEKQHADDLLELERCRREIVRLEAELEELRRKTREKP